MRLLACSDTSDLSFTKDLMEDDDIPPYAILSHTWGDQEVLFNEVLSSTGRGKDGFNKIRFCTEQARRDSLSHCWIDTCCINKNNLVELQDAINSMFRWYARAAQCYVYLSDVSTDVGLSPSLWESSFRASRWFTRGWTLQELLAPRQVTFFSREGEQLGDRTSLEQTLHEITGISRSALRKSTPLDSFTVRERMSWSSGRTTTRKEDIAYSLLGILGVYLPPIYGEGEKHALKRLHREIDASAGDHFRQQALSQSGTLQGSAISYADESAGRFFVPFNRPRVFSGRERPLEQLRAHIASGHCQRVAVHGLGGCGKTALVLETAYWTREHRPACAVFWVPAFSRESFDQAYYQIAKLLGIPDIEDNQADVRHLVKSTLSDDDFGPWLMVVDNADDETVLFDKPGDAYDTVQLNDYLPRSHDGTVIFTTRTRAAAERLADTNVVSLGELEKVDAIAILSGRLFDQHRPQLTDARLVDELLEMLQFHALAIIQATAFINTNEVALFDYIALYRDSEKDATDLLGEDFEDQGRYREATNSVAMTWYISFEQLKKQNSTAADHLCFMACTASNDIETSMFPPLYTKVEHIKAMGTLKTYAFITEQRTPVSQLRGQAQNAHKKFDLHPLVHLAIRGWLKAHRQWMLWIETTLARLIDVIPYGNRDTRKYWQAYLHHGMHLAEVPEVLNHTGRMTLLERIGGCERELGRYGAAERIYRQAYEQRVRMTGREHPDTMMTKGNIGVILGSQGRWNEAATIHREVYSLMSQLRGERDQDTLASRGNLALAALGQQKYAEAEKLYRENLLLSQEILGPKDAGRLTTMHNLAAALRGQAKYMEAHKILTETLALSTEILGEKDAYTLSTLGSLATLHHHQQDFSAAEQLHREALTKRKVYLGEEHPDTITSMLGVAVALRSQNKLQDAEHLQRDALALCEKVSGPKSPYTLTHKSSLAQTLRAQGRYAEAAHLHRETLALREKVLGFENADTAMSVYWLAALAHDQGEYEAALPLYERALGVLRRTVGEGHPDAKECEGQYEWIKGVVEEDRAREEAKAKTKGKEEDEGSAAGEVKERQRADTVACASSIASRADTSETVGTARPQSRWRARLQQLARRAGPRDETF